MRFLATVPEDVRALYASEWSQHDGDTRVIGAAKRLVSDERMREPWARLAQNYNATGGYVNDPMKWGGTFAGAAVSAFRLAMINDPWDSLTQREQDIWRKKVSKLADEFEALAAAGPLPPEGLPVPVAELENFVRGIGLDPVVKWPPGFDCDEAASARRARGQPVTRLEMIWASKASPWNLISAIKHYAKQMQSCAGDQRLRKPRDAKAPRARLIVKLTEYCHSHFDQPMQQLVATSAAVMLDDESINIRLVRRLTVGR